MKYIFILKKGKKKERLSKDIKNTTVLAKMTQILTLDNFVEI